MKSIRAAIYLSIALHFARKTARKLLRIKPKSAFDGKVLSVPQAYSGPVTPVYVSVFRLTPPAAPLPILACANYNLAATVRDFLEYKVPCLHVCAQYPKTPLPPAFADLVNERRIVPLTDSINTLDNHSEIYEALSFVQLKEN